MLGAEYLMRRKRRTNGNVNLETVTLSLVYFAFILCWGKYIDLLQESQRPRKSSPAASQVASIKPSKPVVPGVTTPKVLHFPITTNVALLIPHYSPGCDWS